MLMLLCLRVKRIFTGNLLVLGYTLILPVGLTIYPGPNALYHSINESVVPGLGGASCCPPRQGV